MDAPPATQDSPKHILNVLVNDCIVEIFRRFRDINDLLSASEVCQRFQQSAIICFQSRFKGRIKICPNVGRFPFSDELSFARAPIFLDIFGSYLQDLHIETGLDEWDDELFKLIAKTAGKSLKLLVISIERFEKCKIPSVDFEGTQFVALEKLILRRVSTRNFHQMSQLKSLSLWGFYNVELWFIQQMPLLEKVDFHEIDGLTDNLFEEFLSLNPQLKTLHLRACRNLSVLCIQSICTYLQNLEQLHFDLHGLELSPNVDLNLLGTLKMLKRCILPPIGSVETVINVFAENDVPVEHLFLDECYFLGGKLLSLNTLKSLSITYSFDMNISCLVNLFKTQPTLEDFGLIASGFTISMLEIETLLNYSSKKFKSMDFYVGKLDGDNQSYERLLKATKNKVLINVLTTRNKQRLRINYGKYSSSWNSH